MGGPQSEQEPAGVEAILAGLDRREPFGPQFFISQLGAFVRQQCPDPADGLPLVELHLQSGEILDVCHVIGLAPGWAALAVRESSSAEAPMRTELVRYDAISRVTIRPACGRHGHIGFADRSPSLYAGQRGKSSEEVLAAAAERGAPLAEEAEPPESRTERI